MERLKKFVILAAGLGLLACIAMLAPQKARAVVATLVQVVNTPSSPVPNQDVDHPGRHPFSQMCTGAPSSCVITAPSFQRVVIQYVSAWHHGTPACTYVLLQELDPILLSARLPCVSAGTDGFGPTYIAQGPITLYIEPGKSVNVSETLASSGSAAFEVLVTGYGIAP
jgi:hypothetical protein